jgi:Na+:H+ antiporter, NhaA family
MKSEVYPGIMIMLAAMAAILMCNIGYQGVYDDIWTQTIQITLGSYTVEKQFLPLINEGLMALFFLIVTIEIRYEFLYGILKDKKYLVLPLMAALGGMIVPAAIYLAMTWGSEFIVGWAIPTATDIAFSLACLMLVGSRLSPHLKIFLLALAVIDDLGAIIIIAFYYSDHLSLLMLTGFGAVVIFMILLNRLNVKSLSVYMTFGVIMWVFLLKSGVHATLTGCMVALLLPMHDDAGRRAKQLYRKLLPWVEYIILPLFAFANTGVVLSSDVNVLHPMFLGIFGGLVVGKPVGILLFSYLSRCLGIASFPEGINYRHIFGVALLCGIGFTMSLFVGMLAFDEELLPLLGTVRAGVLSASVTAGVLGMLFLRFCCNEDKYESISTAK